MEHMTYIRFLQVAVEFIEGADLQLGAGNLHKDENEAVS